MDELGGRIIGDAIWNKHKKWPVYSKFFDNMGPIPHHMHQSREQCAREAGGKAGATTSAATQQYGQQLLHVHGADTRHDQDAECKCLEDWNEGDNGIIDLSQAFRLKPGSGWLIGPSILHRARLAVHL